MAINCINFKTIKFKDVKLIQLPEDKQLIVTLILIYLI